MPNPLQLISFALNDPPRILLPLGQQLNLTSFCPVLPQLGGVN
jgi:hypothetical protein